jgi:hypothetical protein
MYKVFVFDCFSDMVSQESFANRISAEWAMEALVLESGQWAEMFSPWGLLSIKE